MKNLLMGLCTLIFLTSVAPKTMAQPAPEIYNKQSLDTCKNKDTVTIEFNQMSSNVKSLTATVDKVSGTLVADSSYVLLQGRVLGTWYNVNTDTLKITNQARNQKVWLAPTTGYLDYRLWYQHCTGTQKSVMTFSYVRRPDEK